MLRATVLKWIDANPQRRLLILLDESDRFFEADAPTFVQTTRLKDLGQASGSAVKVVFAGLHSVQRWAKSARNGPFSHLAQRPTVIGPLRPEYASDLLTCPLDALGFTFADPDLVNRILGFCSYQPFLLQMFGHRLVETMHKQRNVGTIEVPYVITQEDVQAVEEHADLKADIRNAFHETLHLDHRYGVIANVLAYHAHENGLDFRLSDRQLREEYLVWWSAGFATLDVEGFRAYLHEMVGLGVLAPNHDGRGWHLRSPNVLRMIGSQDAVEDELAGADTLSVPEESIALETRLPLHNGRRSPLNAGQVDDVLGDHANQVRVVLGSRGTGIDAVADAVRTATGASGQFTVPLISSRKQFDEQLVDGKPGERRVIVTDLHTLTPSAEACQEALTTALNSWPIRAGVTRSAVIVAGPEQLPLWRAVLEQPERNPTMGVVTLRRFTRTSLRVWAFDSDKFSSDDHLTRLLEITGGWPIVVEAAADLVRRGAGEAAVLRQVQTNLTTPDGANALVDAVGLTVDEDLASAFAEILEFDDGSGMPLSEVIEAATGAASDAEPVVDILTAVQVFDIDDAGNYRVEPVLARCWKQRY